MPICKKCSSQFPNMKMINGKQKSLRRRSYCLECSPYKKNNGYDLRRERSLKERKEKFLDEGRKICPVCNTSFKYTKNNVCLTCRNMHRRQKNKEKIIEYKGFKCKNCGYDKCIGALQFHHRNPSEKKFNISSNLHKPVKILKKEADKCDLLCANCHLELHYKETEDKKEKLLFYYSKKE